MARLSEASHATWVLQGVRDYRRAFDDPSRIRGDNDGYAHVADLAAAEALLASVMAGSALIDLSGNAHHHPTDHDRERAGLAVGELERLGILP